MLPGLFATSCVWTSECAERVQVRDRKVYNSIVMDRSALSLVKARRNNFTFSVSCHRVNHSNDCCLLPSHQRPPCVIFTTSPPPPPPPPLPPPSTMAFACRPCLQAGVRKDFRSVEHMKSHLGSPGTHNMGPLACSHQGCQRRSMRA
jgi:hypothetical protein